MDDLSIEQESPHANPAYLWVYPSIDDPSRLTLQCGDGGYEGSGFFKFSRDEATQLRDWLTNWLDQN